MKEIFIIYNKNTGFIDGGAGRIDRDWDQANADGSTMSERIPEILAKDSDREVIYLPDQNVPNPEKFMIKNGKLVKMTKAETTDYLAALPKTKMQQLEEKIAIIEAKIK